LILDSNLFIIANIYRKDNSITIIKTNS